MTLKDLQLAPDVLVRRNARVLAGGSPFRVMRLSETGAAAVRSWQIGDEVVETPQVRRLAERLFAAQILIKAPRPQPFAVGTVEAVVPVHEFRPAFGSCLAALAAERIPITVVDDGSPEPARIAASAREAGARLIRLDANRGAAAARNAGLASASAPLIAFVDSDVVVSHGWINTIIGHFDDPRVALVAPRVLGLVGDEAGRLAAYESRHSILDMGAEPGYVGYGRRIPYVPGAAMLARREALREGFDESLWIGEDVDLCWRLVESGLRVIYEPRATVRHGHRVRWKPFVRRRWQCASSVAPLACRYPDSLPALRANPAVFASLCLALLGQPAAGAALMGSMAVTLQRRVGDPALSAELVARDALATVSGTARAVRRAWAPFLLVAAARSSLARRVLAGSAALRLADSGLMLRDLPVALADDAVTAGGALTACVRQLTWRPLSVSFTRTPRRGVPREQPERDAAPVPKEAVSGSV